MDDVAPVTPEERAKYETIDFDIADYKNDLKTAKLIHEGDKVSKTLRGPKGRATLKSFFLPLQGFRGTILFITY